MDRIESLIPLDGYLPQQVNHGPWAHAYTLNALQQRGPDASFVLPICSLGTPFSDLENLANDGALLLPPLYHEPLAEMKSTRANSVTELLNRIQQCFPTYNCASKAGAGAGECAQIRVAELPNGALPLPDVGPADVVAFSVDTAVEEHGPHLPLGTDTIQSYEALRRLAERQPRVQRVRPVDYGQLTWGLPFGMSVDITAPLLSEYARCFANSVHDWLQPQAVYVVDVHGSITHRQAIVDGLRASRVPRWLFRWLHEDLAEFASARGDQHAGGVETVLVEQASHKLLDPVWWPARKQDLALAQMSFELAVELTSDLAAFANEVNSDGYNGIIGDINNYDQLDPAELICRMDHRVDRDVAMLLSDDELSSDSHAGKELW